MNAKMMHLTLLLAALSLLSCKDKNQPTVDPQPTPKEYLPVRGYITARYHDWVWENGEQPQLEVYVINPNSYDTVVPLKLTINTCNVFKTELVDSRMKTRCAC